MRGWWNWQTRMFEGHVERSVRVQVPPLAPIFLKRVKKMKKNKKLIAGIDLGGTNVYMLIIDTDGKIYAERHFPTEAEKGPEAVILNMVSNLNDLLKKSKILKKDLTFIIDGRLVRSSTVPTTWDSAEVRNPE